ncbi:unnamed protein product [Rhizophagus irregularis]|nr:unnamed protein product [Rhizophagus irregularis]
MNELFSPPSFNISNINIPEEFGLSRELFFFDNSDNYMQMDQNMVAANDPFITTQGDHVVETNYMTNGIVFQIRGDLNNDEEKVKAKARRIRDLYGKIPSVLRKYSRRPLKMMTLVFIILPINGLLKRNGQEGE